MEFNSEESQIHEDAQALNVCSLQAVVYALRKVEPGVIVLLPSTHVRSPYVILSSRSFSPDRGHLDLYDECYGIYPCKEGARNVQGSRLAEYDHSVEGGEGRSRSSWTNTNSAHSVDIED